MAIFSLTDEEINQSLLLFTFRMQSKQINLLRGMIRSTLDEFTATIARFLLGGFFVVSALTNLLNISQTAVNISSYGIPAAPLIVFFAALFKFLLGLFVILRYHTKISALLLAIYLSFITIIFYGPWGWDTAPQIQFIFMRNVAIIGGLLLLCSYSRGYLLWKTEEMKRRSKQYIDE